MKRTNLPKFIILESAEDTLLTKLKRISIKKEKSISTNAYVLIFNILSIPLKIKIGYFVS